MRLKPEPAGPARHHRHRGTTHQHSPDRPAQAATSKRSVNVWTWNVAGWTTHRGSTTDGLIKVLTDSIRNRDADFVALNELRRPQ